MKLKEMAEKYKIEKNDLENWLLNSLPKELSSSVNYGAFGAVTVDDKSVPQIVDAYHTAIRRKCEEEKQKVDLEQRKKADYEEQQRRIRNIIVTTGDLKQEYEIISPVYFQISNKGVFSSSLSDLKKSYINDITEMKQSGLLSEGKADWGWLTLGEWSVGQNDFEAAFYIATQELKRRAAIAGADAVICMRQDIDIDTNGFAFFYLQMYGTAVRFIKR